MTTDSMREAFEKWLAWQAALQSPEVKALVDAVLGLRGTIDPTGFGAWSSDTPQAKAVFLALKPFTGGNDGK